MMVRVDVRVRVRVRVHVAGPCARACACACAARLVVNGGVVVLGAVKDDGASGVHSR